MKLKLLFEGAREESAVDFPNEIGCPFPVRRVATIVPAPAIVEEGKTRPKQMAEDSGVHKNAALKQKTHFISLSKNRQNN